MGSGTSHTTGEMGLEYLSCSNTLPHYRNYTKLCTTYFFHCKKLCAKLDRYQIIASGTFHTKGEMVTRYHTTRILPNFFIVFIIFHCQNLCAKFDRNRTMGSGTSHKKDAKDLEYLPSLTPY